MVAARPGSVDKRHAGGKKQVARPPCLILSIQCSLKGGEGPRQRFLGKGGQHKGGAVHCVVVVAQRRVATALRGDGHRLPRLAGVQRSCPLLPLLAADHEPDLAAAPHGWQGRERHRQGAGLLSSGEQADAQPGKPSTHEGKSRTATNHPHAWHAHASTRGRQHPPPTWGMLGWW